MDSDWSAWEVARHLTGGVPIVTGRMRSDHSSSVRRLAGCNYGGSGSRVLIMAAMAAARLN
jgi:hypothetical protein